MTEASEENVMFQNSDFTKEFLQLYNATKVENSSEGLTILLHYFMLETGFFPTISDECDKYEQMPENWKGKGVYKIQYIHKCFPSAPCWMTCVPLYSCLAVHGVLDDMEINDSVNLKLNLDLYVNKTNDFSDATQVFTKVKELSVIFKDGFCFALLSQLHENSGSKPTFGLSGLLDELKISILKYLPVESIVTMSAVNKDFNSLVDSPFLWKYLLIRDFGKDGILDIPSSSNEETKWKKLYKKKYFKKRYQITCPFPRIYHPFGMPELFPVGPDYGGDISIAFDPALHEAFPHLRPRFHPPNLFHPFLRDPSLFFRRFW